MELKLDGFNYIPLTGDIIFQDDSRFGPKLVKYFMRSPTIWHDFFRMITGKLEKSEWYHPVMVVYHENQFKSAEQQKRVEFDDLKDEVNRSRLLIVRPLNLTKNQKTELNKIVVEEKGQLWGFVNVWGKFFTWLTGIKLFGRYLKLPNEEVSALRVARWFYKVTGEKFGQKDYRDNTTKTMVDFCLANPQKYEVIYKK